MTAQEHQETAADAVARYVAASCEQRGCRVLVTDRDTLPIDAAMLRSSSHEGGNLYPAITPRDGDDLAVARQYRECEEQHASVTWLRGAWRVTRMNGVRMNLGKLSIDELGEFEFHCQQRLEDAQADVQLLQDYRDTYGGGDDGDAA